MSAIGTDLHNLIFAKVIFFCLMVLFGGGACVVLHAWFYSGGACVVLFGGHAFLSGGCAFLFEQVSNSGGMCGFILDISVVAPGGACVVFSMSK